MLRLHDTLTGTKRPFEPLGDEVKLYVCGLTPYDATHLGHAFTFVGFDVLIRYLQWRGLRVHYVQNVTDVDDPLFAKARQLGVAYQDLAADETKQYLSDMRDLNVLPPREFPRASREIPEMIRLVEELLSRGHAYQVDGHVYFSVASDPEYGKLSKDDRQTMVELARERGGNPEDPLRRDPLDFVLWRPSADDEPRLPSPWGEGLPGWHVECSAMSLKYLGAPLDIHGGGSDLIYPHHEDEIAQSEAATGIVPFSRFWMHTGMVYLGGEKMSKSLGNMVFVRDLLREYSSDAIRLYLSSCHYRDDLHYDEARLEEAAELARELAGPLTPRPPHDHAFDRSCGSQARSLPQGERGSTRGEVNASGMAEPPSPTRGRGVGGEGASAIDLFAYRERFKERMEDDLDTPGAIAVLSELAGEIDARGDAAGLDEARGLLRELGGVLGLRLEGG